MTARPRVLQAQQKRLAAEQAQAQRLADAAEFEVSDLDQALSDALLLIDKGLMPYTSGSSTEKRLINLAIFVMLLVSESGDIEIQATPLYAELVPLARKLGRDAAQTAGNRANNDRGPDFRGHGLKTTKMAGIVGKSSKSPWPLIRNLHEERFGPEADGRSSSQL